MFCEIGKWEKYPDNRISLDNSLRQIGKLEKEGVKGRGDGWMDGWMERDGGKYFFFISSSTSHQGSDLIIIITTIPILILEQHCRQLLLLVCIKSYF
ncbi:hypothetical protein T07_14320 [Trichinella nelsoni]|uniref:Uncharacterized protein n=1 Tax=Trichinella nelsoni TaxID=6336 RepID=A0A0V0SG29_9BILA|nr:hypothetical protein T07_14320 [Trichinella nelsoni]